MTVGLRVNNPLKTRTKHALSRAKTVFYNYHIFIPPYKNILDTIFIMSFIDLLIILVILVIL